MALPRTPIGLNDTRSENIEESAEVMENDNNGNNDYINDDQIDLVSENDTFHELNSSNIPRSTSVIPNNVITSNTLTQTPQTIMNLNIQSNTRQNVAKDSRLNVPGCSKNIANLTKINTNKICIVCEADASRHAYTCKGCNRICHPFCISENEEGTVDRLSESYVCDHCINFLRQSNSNVNKITNRMVRTAAKSTPRRQECKEDSSEDEDNTNLRLRNKRLNNLGSSQHVSSFRKSNRSVTLSDNSSENFFYKLQLRKLPEVTDADLSWSVFYATFSDTKDLFTDHENVIRLQEAIKDPTVKRIGGKGLFNLLTYEKCVEDVNKRLRHNLTFLSSEAYVLENHPKIKAENKEKLVEFMDKVRNFCTLAEAYNDQSYFSNKRFLACISDVIPSYIKNKWETKQADLEDAGLIPTLKHLIRIFDKELPRLEASIRNDKLRNSDKRSENRQAKPVHKGYKFNSHNANSIQRNFSERENNSLVVGKYHSNENRNGFSCWFHKSNAHPSSKCNELWNMDGKVVSDLAKKANICTFCGQTQHQPCPYNSKLKCRIPGCNFPHHMLYCYKRLAQQNKPYSHNHTKNEKPKSLTLKKDNKSQDEPSTSKSTVQNKSVDQFESLIQSLQNPSYYTNITDKFTNPDDSPKISHFIANFNHNIFARHCESDKNILGILVVKVEHDRNLAFLMDSGSSVSLLEEKVANELNKRGPWAPLTLTWSGNQSRTDVGSRIVELVASNLSFKSVDHPLCFHTVKDLKITPQKFLAKECYENFPTFKNFNLMDYHEISGVIGIDNIFVFEPLHFIKTRNNNGIEFHGVRCPLGDYIYGTTQPLRHIFKNLDNKIIPLFENKTFSHNILTESEQNELIEMEKEVMGLEYHNPKENDRIIFDEKQALDLLNKNVKKIDNANRYVVPLLWKNENVNLPTDESFKLAMRRYLIIEKQALKLNRFEECVEQIRNLLIKNYAVEMTYEEAVKQNNKAYYNPVFFIHPQNKRTRLIWDLAAKIDGKCLNDYLNPGPNLYNNMLEILFKMREHDYLFKGDIGEMFHQVMVDSEDTNALRFLFRFSPHEKIRTFKLLVLPFGATCSPLLSQFVKDKVANEYMSEFPQSCEIITKYCYVDDIIKSVPRINDAIELPIEIKRILKKGGFNFLKLNSNNKLVLNEIKKKLTQDELAHDKLFSEEINEKLLGYNIDFQNDEISLAFSLSKIPDELLNKLVKPTKRQVLQTLMSIFDPIGLFQFFTSKLKLLYHRVCQRKIDWEEIISEEENKLWLKCIDWLPEIIKIKVPRLYCAYNDQVSKIQLLCFGDAGKEIMCATIYARFLNKFNLPLDVCLIYSKSFVVPWRQNRTIPELELNVASKIVEMSQDVIKMHTLKFCEIKYFTDSSAVKEWISNGAKKATIYVKNRLDKIKSLTKVDQWFWIPSELMPADFGTKENSMPEINCKNKWFNPEIFRLPEKYWSYQSNMINTTNLSYVSIMGFDQDDNILDASKFSKYDSLINTAQLAMKWKNKAVLRKINDKIDEVKLKITSNKHDRSLKNFMQELIKEKTTVLHKIHDRSNSHKHIEMLAIKLAQNEEYEKEIAILNEKKILNKNNRLFKLSPFLDGNGVLRAKSRISCTENNIETFGIDRIYPIILPKNHPLTKLIIIKYHVDNHHMITNTVITKLLRRFHISHIKWTVSNIIKQNCYVCRRNNAKPEIPMMGCLPGYRLAFHCPPFSYSMIDLAGPIIVKNYRSRDVKRYIFVYVCLTTRAVHLELIEDLSSNSTLLALQNVINLRGAPKRIVSDNGTNFVGANTILNDAQTKWNYELLKKGIIVEPIEWDFPPARAPHFQGSVERMVGLTKTALKKMTDTLNAVPNRYNDFQLRTILYEITGLLNNRPLTMFPIENSISEFLTPNHFLMGRQNVQTVPIVDYEIKNLHSHWLDVKNLTNILWKHWLSAYVPLIMMREKWIDRKSPLKVDDIVIVADPSIANSWRMGKIIETKMGSENQVRSVTIKLGKNKPMNIQILNNSRNHILKVYKDENQNVINRPAIAVAKLSLN